MQTSVQTSRTFNPILDLVTTLAEITRKMIRRVDVRDNLDEAHALLESLPLSTDEFGLACNRLWNVGRFVVSGEYGAANWELQTLRMWVLRIGNAPVARHQRNRWIP